MTEQSWTPTFRTTDSTVTKVLRSPAFNDSRGRARVMIDDSLALRMLANSVEKLDHHNAPLAGVADRVAAAVRFLRAKAGQLDSDAAPSRLTGSAEPREDQTATPGAANAARERLLVAALDYLVTPVDLVPDFHAGGYIDDVLLLTWVFGAAVTELEPFLADDLPG